VSVIVAVICQLPLAPGTVIRVTGLFGNGPLGPPKMTAPVGLSAVLEEETFVSMIAVAVAVAPRLMVAGAAVTVTVVALNTFTVMDADAEEA
jgi:hypothetical protein